MSVVTSAIILCYGHGIEPPDGLTGPLPFDQRQQSFVRVRATETECGGNKVFESRVYAAALNHINPEHLEEWFRAIPWPQYESAVLAWDCEGRNGAVVITGEAMY